MRTHDLLRILVLSGCLVAAVGPLPSAEWVDESVDKPGGASRLALVDNDDLEDLGWTGVVHNYGGMSLVRAADSLTSESGIRIHLLPPRNPVHFRGWSGSLAPVSEFSAANGGVLIFGLIGPMDQRWRAQLEADGVEILAAADPHAVVVRTDRGGLDRALPITTSEGVPVIRTIGTLPVEARVHRSLVPALDGGASMPEVELRLSDYGGRPFSIRTKGSGSEADVVRLDPGELGALLDLNLDIGYVEPVFGIELHNNLAARPSLIAVETLWDLGYNGAGVTVSHNDSGMDLEHPDVIGAVRAAVGRMAYTDNAHGSHTAGSIIGRGVFSSPQNTSGCGDLTIGLPSVRGMAWGAEIVTNNLFEGGHEQIPGMMAWGVRNGAQLSSNSWGLLGQTEPEVGYSAAAAQVDAAVRDADPDAPGFQPLAIFFSAGNTGPLPGTVTSPGTAKNAITIGAVENDRCGAWVPARQQGPDPHAVLIESGRGPSQGRVKPDLVAPGSDLLSLESGDPYSIQILDEGWTGPELALNTGTSQACAVAAGAGAVLHEFLWRTRGRRPSPALLKAAMVAAADAGAGGVDFARGWGRVDLAAAATGPDTGSVFFVDQDETAELVTGAGWSTTLTVLSPSEPLVVAVVWTDPPGEEDADHPLVNDLDVVLTSPSDTEYRGNVLSDGWSVPDPGAGRDSANNLEVIRIEAPDPGTWIVSVVGVDVSLLPTGLAGQDFAVAVSGDAAPCAETPPSPVDVEAVGAGDNRIRVSWSVVSGATSYEVSRSDNPGGMPYVPVATLAAGIGSFLDTDVSGGDDYHYVVRAHRSCWSAYSDEASATATGPCRSAPVFTGIASVDDPAHAGCSLELSWAGAEASCPSLVSYSIYRGDHPHFEIDADSLLVDSLVDTRWSDQLLESGRTYYYAVRAWHHGEGGDDGNSVVIGGQPTGPDDVFLFEDVEGDIDEWIRQPGTAADTGTDGWEVTTDDAWAGESAFFVADEDRVKDQVLLTAEPIALPEGSEPVLEFFHRYRLERGLDGGRLEVSTNGGRDWIDILEGDGQTVPDDPQRWLTGGYTDTIGAPSNPLFLVDAWTGDSRGWVRSRVDLGDFAGLRILLRWRMGCDESPGVGWGWWLDEIRLVVENECLPCRVSSPAIDLVARADPNGVELEWEEGSLADAYRISRAADPGGPFRRIAEVAAPETTYLDSSASGGTDYTYVIAVGAAGCWTDDSAGVTVTAGGPCKLAPLFWGLDEIVDRREAECALDLEWRPGLSGCAGAEVAYRIYRSESEDFIPDSESLLADGVNGPRYRDTTVIDGELVHYRVRAVDDSSGAEEKNEVIHSGWTTGPQEIHFSDSVEGDPEQWWTGLGSTADSGTDPWTIVDDVAHGGLRSWFCTNEPRVKDQVVGLTRGFEINDETTVLSFFHLYDVEPFWDGGRLEYSTDGGSAWHDVLHGDGSTVGDNPARFLRGGYSGFVSVGTGHPFGGERAWTGFDVDWTETVVDLSDFVGLTVLLRWRFGCDRSDARVGWWIDDVELRTTATCETTALPAPRQGQGRRP